MYSKSHNEISAVLSLRVQRLVKKRDSQRSGGSVLDGLLMPIHPTRPKALRARMSKTFDVFPIFFMSAKRPIRAAEEEKEHGDDERDKREASPAAREAALLEVVNVNVQCAQRPSGVHGEFAK